MRSATLFLLLVTAGPQTLRAQDCPAGQADTLPNAGDGLDGMALHWSPEQVSQAVPRVLRSLRYRVVETGEQGTRFVTAPGREYPKEALLQWLRDYPHPGMVVTVLVRSEGDSTRLYVFARSVCAVERPPPPGYTGKVDDTFERIAAQDVAFGVVGQLRRDHPRRY